MADDVENSDKYSSDFTAARPVAAEGARVGLVTCKACGATLTIDLADDFNVLETHAAWHRSLDTMHGITTRGDHVTVTR